MGTKNMPQQQQSNMVKPQKIGGKKVAMSSGKPVGMDDISNLSKAGQAKWNAKTPVKTAIKKAVTKTPTKKALVKKTATKVVKKAVKMPSYNQVQKSVKKSMGY